MLTTLRIKNLALVDDLTLEFQAGYNVITGETGAGKSILIGALNLVLGERADRTLIRSGCDNCSVEAVFEAGRLEAPIALFLEEHGLEPCEDGSLVLKRTFTSAGGNRQFINGSPATLNRLAELGQYLVDIHGPHEHQSLLHPSCQLAILDAFGGLEAEREAFSDLVRRRAALEAEKAALIMDERTYSQQLDLLRFQVNEISVARLAPEEEEQVEQDYRRASNAARLRQLSQAALDLLSDNDPCLLTQSGLVGRTLQELQRVDPSAAPLLTIHEQTVSVLRELQAELGRYAGKIEIEPARLQQLEERLNLLHSLKRKYGSSVAAVIAFGQEVQHRLEALEARETELARLNNELGKVGAELRRAGEALTVKRRKVIPQLCRAVVKQLAELGFKQSRFDATLMAVQSGSGDAASSQDAGEASVRARFPSSGLDALEFEFAPNPGEPARPLRAIASSGELARVMLALKTVLAVQDQVPVLVFDEVDANVGGETAHAVGQKMRQIAERRQVLCITHLPQVAAPASAHYLASKQTRAGRTVSEITLLNQAERVTELARMLGGQSQEARQHAQALLRVG